jgi:hypothetical protein
MNSIDIRKLISARRRRRRRRKICHRAVYSRWR